MYNAVESQFHCSPHFEKVSTFHTTKDHKYARNTPYPPYSYSDVSCIILIVCLFNLLLIILEINEGSKTIFYQNSFRTILMWHGAKQVVLIQSLYFLSRRVAQACYIMSSRKPTIEPNGQPGQFSTSQLFVLLYMTGLAGPARLSDQMPRSGAGNAVLRSGHLNTTLFRPFFFIGKLSIFYTLRCCCCWFF